MRTSALKQPIIDVFCASGLKALACGVQNWRFGTNFLRAVNYHATPTSTAETLEAHFSYLSRAYISVGREGLDDVLSGRWRSNRPALILSFDDGLRSNYSVAKPLLEKYRLIGWFFLPSGIIEDCSWGFVQDQVSLARDRNIRLPSDEDHLGGVFMTWDDARELVKHHVVGCHSMTHERLRAALGEEALRREIIEAKLLMENRLNCLVDSFCWIGGEEPSYSREAAGLIREAGYRYAFMTNMHPVTNATDPLQLQRTNLESGWPLHWVEFYLSGIMDALRSPRRRRVNRLTSYD